MVFKLFIQFSFRSPVLKTDFSGNNRDKLIVFDLDAKIFIADFIFK